MLYPGTRINDISKAVPSGFWDIVWECQDLQISQLMANIYYQFMTYTFLMQPDATRSD